MKAKESLGQHSIIGVFDFDFSNDLKAFLNEYTPGGLALFNSPHDQASHIWNDPNEALERVYEFVAKSQEYNIFLCVDQEGGKVRRLRSPFVELPSAQQAGELWNQQQAFDMLHELFQWSARQLKETLISWNFAPVCDLRTTKTHSMLAERCFSDEKEVVVEVARAFCQVFESEGIHCSLKHFPGHGSSRLDSHEKIAVLDKTRDDIESEDLSIFKELASYASSIMTAHVAYQDEPKKILSLDPEYIQSYKDLFSEVRWITDDLLRMKAVSDQSPLRRAIDCGYDYFLLCGKLDEAARSLDDGIRHIEQSQANLSELKVAIRHHKTKLKAFSLWKKDIIEMQKKAHQLMHRLGI